MMIEICFDYSKWVGGFELELIYDNVIGGGNLIWNRKLGALRNCEKGGKLFVLVETLACFA